MPPDDVAAPASAPAAPDSGAPSTPDTSTPSPPSDGGEAFSGLGTDFDDGDVSFSPDSAAGEQTPPADAAAKEAPAEPPKAAPAATPPPAPPQQPAQAPAQGPQESRQAGASPPSEPRTLVQQIQQHRGEIMEELARTRFAWDPGEQKQFTDALEADAPKALVEWAPKIMARMYYESATMALNHINQFTPVLVANFTKLMDQQRQAEDTFFKQFPQLSKEKHWPDVLQFASVFGRQPGITQADLLAMVGSAVMAKNRLSLGAPNGASPRKPSAPPFVPAAAGGSPARVVREPESPYAGLGGVYDED